MGQTADQIESEIAEKRTALADNLDELRQKARATVDWRSQIHERPGTMLAIAFGGGILLSALFSALRGPAKVYAESPSDNLADNDPPANKTSTRSANRPTSATRKNLDALGGALLGIAATRTSNILEEILPGFRSEFERARNSQR